MLEAHAAPLSDGAMRCLGSVMICESRFWLDRFSSNFSNLCEVTQSGHPTISVRH